MKRRRPVEPTGTTSLPEELRVCWVQDWALPPTVADIEHYIRSIHPTPSEAEARWVLWVTRARGRWGAARREWAEKNDVELSSLPSSAPRWRTSEEMVHG